MSEDINGLTMLMTIFGLTLLAYGECMRRTGNKSLLPVRAMHSVQSADDVRRIGRIVEIIGAVVLVISLTARLLPL